MTDRGGAGHPADDRRRCAPGQNPDGCARAELLGLLRRALALTRADAARPEDWLLVDLLTAAITAADDSGGDRVCRARTVLAQIRAVRVTARWSLVGAADAARR